MNRKLVIAAGIVICLALAVLLGAIYVLKNPELVIDRHRDGMNAAAETILRDDDATAVGEAHEAFIWHRDQLVRLEALETRTYLARASSRETLIDSLIDQSRGLPVCEWRPDATGVHITVWGNEEELRAWDELIDGHQPQ